MEIQIISEQIIKPSSPTPNHLRIHKLCLLEQLVPPYIHFPFIFFYSAANKDTTKTSDELKKSLSETLTHYYPFAGRLKDHSFIDCDDHGATFIEVQVAGNMAEVLKQPEMDLLERLLPYKLDEKLGSLVAVQVSYFGCGGVAIGVCFSHVVTDATAAAYFVKNWAALASSCGSSDLKDLIVDCTNIFPPQDVVGLTDSVCEGQSSYAEIITKRFVFDASKIAALREEIGNGSRLDGPTRFEAVSALILSAVMTAIRETNELTATHLAASMPVNLRKRMNPPLPEQCIGNICTTTTAMCPINQKIECKNLAGKLHESIRMMDDEYLRKVYGGDEFMNFLRNAVEGLCKNRLFWTTSWCKLPYYEADFGWGKPKWVATTVRDDKVAMLLDSCDGEGIEAWIGLSKQDMAKFEQDPGILAYASVNPSPF